MPSHVIVLPLSKETDDEVASELLVENLREEVKVADKSSLQNDGDVRGVEELDLVGLRITLHLPACNGQFNSETL